MGGICRVGWNLLAVAMAAVMCAGLFGCSDKEEFWWDDDRSNAKVVGFVDDSLVIVGDFRFWHETTERWNGEYLEGRGAGNPRLCLYNYRVQEGGPRWCDSLSEEKSSGWFGGQMTDSIVWGGVLGEYIKLWKIGDEPHEMKLTQSFEGCSQKVSVQRIHQWLDGKFIALGSYSMNSRTLDNALTSLDSGASYCQYAVLDTVGRTLVYKRLDENLKWIEKCDDVRAWGEDVYCLQTIPNADQIGRLLVNGVDQGKLEINAAIGPFWGDMLELGNNLCELADGGLLKCLPVRWLGGAGNAKFVDENGNTVYLNE